MKEQRSAGEGLAELGGGIAMAGLFLGIAMVVSTCANKCPPFNNTYESDAIKAECEARVRKANSEYRVIRP